MSINSDEDYLLKGRSMEYLPPTSVALYHHALRAAYQAGHVWAQACGKDPVIPPENWGWSKTYWCVCSLSDRSG